MTCAKTRATQHPWDGERRINLSGFSDEDPARVVSEVLRPGEARHFIPVPGAHAAYLRASGRVNFRIVRACGRPSASKARPFKEAVRGLHFVPLLATLQITHTKNYSQLRPLCCNKQSAKCN